MPIPAADFLVRLARPDEADALPPIERSAGNLFLGAPGLAWVADHTLTPASFYGPLIEAGTVWVAVGPEGGAVGFLAAEAVDCDLHVWELAVHSEAQRRGLGRRLMRTVLDHARAQGLEALTLTTFRDVDWNAPFYAALGFRVLEDRELGVWLAEILRGEAARGLPAERRCAMRQDTAEPEEAR